MFTINQGLIIINNNYTQTFSRTWHPELPEWLIFYNLDGIVLSLMGVLRMEGEVHHVEEEVVLSAGVLEVLIILNSQPLAWTHLENWLKFILLQFSSVLFFNQKLI